jgi:hypothetical protein
MKGKASSFTHSTVTAARIIAKKSVFCVDNVSISCSENDIVTFVRGMGIRVHTCHEVEPRRNRQSEYRDQWIRRKAFRLCIDSDDQNTLLNPERWPDSVTVSDWYFRPRQPQQLLRPLQPDDAKRRRVASDETGQPAGDDARSEGPSADRSEQDGANNRSHDSDAQEEDMEATILTCPSGAEKDTHHDGE